MKISRIAAIPFALVADAVTMGNMGDRSFTQQVFDAERREQNEKQEESAVKAVSGLVDSLARAIEAEAGRE